MNTPSRNDLVARSWLDHAKDRETVIFTVDVQHAQDLASAFCRYGVAAEAIWGDDPERETKLSRHRAGGIQVLTNCQWLTEGYDDHRNRCIGGAKPTPSEGLNIQIVGRGTRIPDNIENPKIALQDSQYSGKRDCVVLDFVDATSKHSLVTLPSLCGMAVETDRRGRSIDGIGAEIEGVRKRNPLLDLSKVLDVNQLEIYPEQVDLQGRLPTGDPSDFQVSVAQDAGENAYALTLANKRDGLGVVKTLLDKWSIYGKVNGSKVEKFCDSFEEATREADFQVGLLAGAESRVW